MAVFLANRENIQTVRIHREVKNRIRGSFQNVRMKRAGRRDPGTYRVIGELDPRIFFDSSDYPTDEARIEIGFDIGPSQRDPREFYWLNWIEPKRNLMVGWHQDDDHDPLGPVHIQVNYEGEAKDHQPATFIDDHPLAVVPQRLDALEDAVTAVEWNDGEPTGFDVSASVIDQDRLE